MRKMIIGVLAVLGCTAAPNRELIVCGADEVYILDLNRQPPEKVWSWRAVDSPEIPPSLHKQFRTTDDCKPVDGGKRILITSSSDGLALVERATRKALFYGSAGGAHSAEMLPGDRIAVAASTSTNAFANSLVLFDARRSAEPLFVAELVSGHGVVWDQMRNVLWALGGKSLRKYSVAKDELRKMSEIPLPAPGGHDFVAVSNTYLLLTTLRNVWLFDRSRHTFEPHPQLKDKADVKSVSIHPVTGEIAWTQADRPDWWTATIRFLNPTSTLVRKGERLYKVRWVQ